MSFKFSALAATALICALCPVASRAALGEPEEGLAAEAQRMKGEIHSTQNTVYHVHQIQLPSGTLLKEFAGSDGNVFAVAWSGPALPDLREALGRYFDTYVGAQKEKRGRGPVEIRQDNLVVQSGGHMRAFTGRAYLSQNLPTGMSIDEVR